MDKKINQLSDQKRNLYNHIPVGILILPKHWEGIIIIYKLL